MAWDTSQILGFYFSFARCSYARWFDLWPTIEAFSVAFRRIASSYICILSVVLVEDFSHKSFNILSRVLVHVSLPYIAIGFIMTLCTHNLRIIGISIPQKIEKSFTCNCYLLMYVSREWFPSAQILTILLVHFSVFLNLFCISLGPPLPYIPTVHPNLF